VIILSNFSVLLLYLRVCLMPTGCLELWSDGTRRRSWSWSELDSAADRDPFPKVYPLVLGVNYNCGIRIFSQHNMSLTFSAECRSCRFRVGARVKVGWGIGIRELAEGTNALFLKSPVVDEERSRPGHWLGQCSDFRSVLRDCCLDGRKDIWSIGNPCDLSQNILVRNKWGRKSKTAIETEVK